MLKEIKEVKGKRGDKGKKTINKEQTTKAKFNKDGNILNISG